MLRRGYSRNKDSLPTHSGSGGLGRSFSGSRGYGGFHGGSSSSIGSMYGDASKHSQKSRFGFSPLGYVSLGMAVVNVILTGLWMSSRGHYRSFVDGLNARDVKGAIDKIKWAEREASIVRNEMMKERRDIDRRYPRIKKLEQENVRWKKERDELRERYESLEKRKEDARLKQREPAYMHQISLMQQAIRKESKRTILERFVDVLPPDEMLWCMMTYLQSPSKIRSRTPRSANDIRL